MKKSIQERFEEKIERIPECGCWIWTAHCDKSVMGYGRLKMSGAWKWAHRVAWELYRGIIPAGLCVLHRCDTPACVNPHHLFLGTRHDNAQDRISKNRDVRGEDHGMAKLRESDVLSILADDRKQNDIAQDYGITQQGVSSIKRRKNWGHL